MEGYPVLEPGSWAGLLELPPAPGFPAASPVLIIGVKPLEKRSRLVQIDLVQPLHPGGGRRRSFRAKPHINTSEFFTFKLTNGGEPCHLQLEPCNLAWLRRCCPDLLSRHPPSGATLILDGAPVVDEGAASYLARMFGRTPDEISTGVNRRRAKSDVAGMSAQRTCIAIDTSYEPFDSCLIARGFRSCRMEDKWDIVFDAGRLLFYRSWTGSLIYDVEASWRGDRLNLGNAWVNRAPGQYGQGTDRDDAALVRYLVDVILRGVRAECPAMRSKHASEQTPEQLALEAWAAAGSASLG